MKLNAIKYLDYFFISVEMLLNVKLFAFISVLSMLMIFTC